MGIPSELTLMWSKLARQLAGNMNVEFASSLNCRPRRKLLEQILEVDLDSHGAWRLRNLLAAHDRVNPSIGELD